MNITNVQIGKNDEGYWVLCFTKDGEDEVLEFDTLLELAECADKEWDIDNKGKS